MGLRAAAKLKGIKGEGIPAAPVGIAPGFPPSVEYCFEDHARASPGGAARYFDPEGIVSLVDKDSPCPKAR